MILLYIHIPFCDSKCHYCAFNSYVDKFSMRDSYIDALIRQFEFEKTKFKSFDTFFIGGGTPSTISVNQYKKLFSIISKYFNDNIEITKTININLLYY